MMKNSKPGGNYNQSPDDFEALKALAEIQAGLSEQEFMDGLKELIEKDYVRIIEENGTFSIVLVRDDLPFRIKRAMRIIFADLDLTVEEKMVHNYCAMVVQRASGVVNIGEMSAHLGLSVPIILESLRVLKNKKHIDYVVNGNTCVFTLLHVLGLQKEPRS